MVSMFYAMVPNGRILSYGREVGCKQRLENFY